MYKLSKTNIFFSHFEGKRGEKNQIFRTKDNVIHVSMPEISKEVMSDFLESLYLGAVPTDLNVFEEFRNLSETFMLFSEYERPDSPEVKLRTVIVNPRFSDKITSIETEV